MTTVLRLLCDPDRLEEVLGDLEELQHRRGRAKAATRLRALLDVLSVCLVRSRLAAMWRRHRPRRLLAATLTVAAMTSTLLFMRAPNASSHRFTVYGHDPAGTFTLEVLGGEVLGATMDGTAVPQQRLWQRDQRLVILGDSPALDLTVDIDRRGQVSWQPRTPSQPPAP